MLAYFPTLTQLDLRDNPLTLGLYSTMPPSTGLVLHTNPGASAAKRDDSDEVEPFALRDLDPIQDAKYHARLDMETKMRRRAYEMLLLNGDRRLKKLDGLDVDRDVLTKQDAVWEEMLKLGLVKDMSNEASLLGGELPVEENATSLAKMGAPEIEVMQPSRPSSARSKQYTPTPRHAEVHTVLDPDTPPPYRQINETSEDADESCAATDRTDEASTVRGQESVSSSFYREPMMEEVADPEIGRGLETEDEEAELSPDEDSVRIWKEVMGDSVEEEVEGMDETSRWQAEDRFA